MSDISEWHYVDTLSNPADIASRGAKVSDTSKVEMWLNGPAFLRETVVPITPLEIDTNISDPEQLKSVLNISLNDNYVMQYLVDKFSTWRKMVRVVAYLLRFKAATASKLFTMLSVEELRVAEQWGSLGTNDKNCSQGFG